MIEQWLSNAHAGLPDARRDVFQDCLLDHMEISIVEAEKRANRALNLREFYTVYLIETK
jgi:sorting nexin-4